MRAVVLILASLFSTVSMANSYCESRQDNRTMFQCYEGLAQQEGLKMKGLYEKIRNHPASTAEAMQQLEFDHENWAGLMSASCRDTRCVYRAVVSRNDLLISRFNALGPVQKVNQSTENCLNAWIGAFREEMGDEVPIFGEQLEEWEDWCANGRYP